MFKEATQHTGDADIFADTRNSRNQTADTANDEFNFDAGLRREGEGFNYFRIHQAIHFSKDAGFATGQGGRRFGGD